MLRPISHLDVLIASKIVRNLGLKRYNNQVDNQLQQMTIYVR